MSKSISICNILTEMFRLVTQKFILQFQASNLMKEKKKKTDIFKNEREKKKKDIFKLLIYYESN